MQQFKFGHVTLFSFLVILLANCELKTKTENTTEPDTSVNVLGENLSDFTNKLTDNDTIKIFVDLSMEWWVRIDELILTRDNHKIQLQTIIKEDTTFERKYQMRANKLEEITIKNKNNEFERYFTERVNRLTREDKNEWIYQIISKNDTLTFYTNGLDDKGGQVSEYLKFMRNYHPEQEEFKILPDIEIIDLHTVGNTRY